VNTAIGQVTDVLTAPAKEYRLLPIAYFFPIASPARFLQLFEGIVCPAYEYRTAQSNMKSNIIYLNPTGSSLPQSIRIDLHTEKDFIDSALVIWLGAWTLIATFAFLAN
jgi:hypothetical protein